MFEEPTKRDIDAALSALMHEARRKTQDAKNLLVTEATKVGALRSNRLIIVTADEADKAHKTSVKDAQKVLLDFVERMRIPAQQITEWAHPHLENLSNSVLALVPANGFPADHQRITNQYMAVFKQRVDQALRAVEIGYNRDVGFTAQLEMPQEEWLSAAEAKAMLHAAGISTNALCLRANAGLVKARAVRFVRDQRAANDAEVPESFWWARGHAALTQDWKTGDFETWIDQKIQLQAFNVSFRRADIEAMIPAPPAVAALPATPAKAAGGRPKAVWSDDLWVEMCRQLYVGDLKPKKQVDVTKAMTDWLSAQGNEPSDSTIKDRARKLWAAIKDEN